MFRTASINFFGMIEIRCTRGAGGHRTELTQWSSLWSSRRRTESRHWDPSRVWSAAAQRQPARHPLVAPAPPAWPRSWRAAAAGPTREERSWRPLSKEPKPWRHYPPRITPPALPPRHSASRPSRRTVRPASLLARSTANTSSRRRHYSGLSIAGAAHAPCATLRFWTGNFGVASHVQHEEAEVDHEKEPRAEKVHANWHS